MWSSGQEIASPFYCCMNGKATAQKGGRGMHYKDMKTLQYNDEMTFFVVISFAAYKTRKRTTLSRKCIERHNNNVSEGQKRL